MLNHYEGVRRMIAEGPHGAVSKERSSAGESSRKRGGNWPRESAEVKAKALGDEGCELPTG